MSENDKKIIDQETVHIRQLLKDQEDEINIEKKKYDQLLEMFSNVKKNVADTVKESLPEILKETLKGTNISDDIKKLVTDKTEEMIEKISEKIKGVGVEEEKNFMKNIQRNKPLTDKPIDDNVQALQDPNLDYEEKEDLLRNDIELEQWKEIYAKLLQKLGNIKNDIADAVKESLPEILNEALKDINIGDNIKQAITNETEKVINKIDEDPKYDDLQKQIDDLRNTQRPV
ncbi:5705_t:CDS:2 [Scutellospora calospora]|uniref:5705_t:CDS:1 n=1 Tax=Scutellospora calospora TaxID=85575 RepID=A0ACA9M7I7_9GLOM|nr:5705_t:CDS:2 [Scutellospora calospora]